MTMVSPELIYGQPDLTYKKDTVKIPLLPAVVVLKFRTSGRVPIAPK